MRNYNYKCVVSNIGSKRYYKSVRGKWKRITNVAGMKAEKGRRKYSALPDEPMEDEPTAGEIYDIFSGPDVFPYRFPYS